MVAIRNCTGTYPYMYTYLSVHVTYIKAYMNGKESVHFNDSEFD